MNFETACVILAVATMIGCVFYLILAVCEWIVLIYDCEKSRKQVDWLNVEGKNEDLFKRGQSQRGNADTMPEGERASAQS